MERSLRESYSWYKPRMALVGIIITEDDIREQRYWVLYI
jgi:hypothetical protein